MAAASEYKTKVTLPSDREILITREFDAPRDVVFKAMIDPALISRWWGPRGHTTRVDKMEVRPGGAWRYISGTSAGVKSASFGSRDMIRGEKSFHRVGLSVRVDDADVRVRRGRAIELRQDPQEVR